MSCTQRMQNWWQTLTHSHTHVSITNRMSSVYDLSEREWCQTEQTKQTAQCYAFLYEFLVIYFVSVYFCEIHDVYFVTANANNKLHYLISSCLVFFLFLSPTPTPTRISLRRAIPSCVFFLLSIPLFGHVIITAVCHASSCVSKPAGIQ